MADKENELILTVQMGQSGHEEGVIKETCISSVDIPILAPDLNGNDIKSIKFEIDWVLKYES